MARYFETCIEITNADFLIKKSIILQIENILKFYMLEHIHHTGGAEENRTPVRK